MRHVIEVTSREKRYAAGLLLPEPEEMRRMVPPSDPWSIHQGKQQRSDDTPQDSREVPDCLKGGIRT